MTPRIPDVLRARLGRRAFLRSAIAVPAAAAAIYAAGCGGGDDGDTPPEETPATPPSTNTAADGDIRPVMLTSEFVSGRQNRFVVGLLQGGDLLKDADVHVRFFTVGADGSTGTLRGEGDLQFVELNVAGAHEHDSSAGDVASDDSTAFYVGYAPFDIPGRWGVEMNVTPPGGGTTKAQVPFEVLAESKSPPLGSVPPASRNDTAATNPNTESLCSRDPICPLHDKVIADVLGKGRPLVVQFSTPAFCETRFCGPVLEVLLERVPEYEDRVDFVHIEVWEDFQAKRYRRAAVEWNLPTEPYTFFMDGEGKVVGKLESIFSEEELENALNQLVDL